MIEFVCWSDRDKRRVDTRAIARAGLFVQKEVRTARRFQKLHSTSTRWFPRVDTFQQCLEICLDTFQVSGDMSGDMSGHFSKENVWKKGLLGHDAGIL